MTFLGLFFLVALPLAAAPIVLHLYDRQRRVVIEWGAMQFLTEAATQRRSARRFKQWLLLMLRVATLAALIAALARPIVPGDWFGQARRTETILVVDNSLSMSQQRNGEGTLFDAAVAKGIGLIGAAPAGDAVRVLMTSPYPDWVTASSVRLDATTREELIRSLGSLRPGAGRSDLLSAVLTALQSDRDPLLQDRRIVVLTDGQGGDWRFADEPGWGRLQQMLSALPAPVEMEVVELAESSAAASNLAVNAVEADRTVVGRDRPVRLSALLQNHGAPVAGSTAALWRIGEEVLFESQVPSLAAGGVHEAAWTHSFTETGVHAVTCRLDAREELTADNEGTVVVEVVDEVPIVVVEGNASGAELQRDAFFVQAALGRLDEGSPSEGIYAPSLFDPTELGEADFARCRAVVVPNLTSLDQSHVESLREFVQSGGGLWIALGPRTDIDAFNQRLYAEGHGLAPLPIEGIENASPDESSAAVTIGTVTGDHPALRMLADAQQLDLSDVRVERRFRFSPVGETGPVSVLLRDTRGEPLAVERYFGRGRVIVQGIPLKLQWSELARSQSFVVLVRSWLDYLTQPLATRHNLAPGDPIVLHAAAVESPEAVLTMPSGDAVPLTGEPSGDGLQFRTSRTSAPGRYTIEAGLAGETIPYYVSRDPAESDLAPLVASERKQLAAAILAARNPTLESDEVPPRQQPLWPMLLSLVIVLLMCELFLSGAMARERFGGAPVAETSEIPGLADQVISPSAAAGSPAGRRRPAMHFTRTAN